MDYSDGNEAENAKTPKKPARKKAGKYGKFVFVQIPFQHLSKQFFFIGSLTYHEYREIKIPCNICGRSVQRRGIAKHNATKHGLGELLYSCDLCGSKYFDKVSVQYYVPIRETDILNILIRLDLDLILSFTKNRKA